MAQKSNNLIVTVNVEVCFEDVSGSQKLMNMRSSNVTSNDYIAGNGRIKVYQCLNFVLSI